MRFEEWWRKESGWGGEELAEYHLAKAAWNRAIGAAINAIDSADHSACDAGIGAMNNAIESVEKLAAN